MACVRFVILAYARLRKVKTVKRRTEIKFVSCPGSRFHTHYDSRFDGRRVVLVESGVTDVQQSIESFGKYTDIHYMLHRLSVGDNSVLSGRVPLYGDFSGLPTNPLDAINIVQSAESLFGQLSLEERAVYNNDFRAWLASRLSGPQTGGSAVSDPVPITDPVKEVVSE